MAEVLGKLLGSEARVKVMRLFLVNPGEVFTPLKISKSLKLNRAKLRREITLLKSIGFLKRGISETEVFVKSKKRLKKKREPGFHLNNLFPYNRELRALVVDASPISRELVIKRFKRLGRGLRLVVLSGIFINRPDSVGTDVLVVGDNLRRSKVEKIFGKIESEIGKELNYTLFDTEEFKYRQGMYDGFILDIFEREHDVLIDQMGAPR